MGPNGRGKNRGREKNTERGRPNGGKHLRGKTHGKGVVSTQREVPRKRKDQMGNNPRQESNKKLRVYFIYVYVNMYKYIYSYLYVYI